MAAHNNMRSLMPKEHGAYGQLALPLITALLCGSPTLAALFYTAASVLAFFAHEPLLVLLGHRGSRALRESGARARVRFLLLAALGLFCTVLALAWSALGAQLVFLVPLLGAALVGFAIWRTQERTAWGEIAAASALSSAGLPVAIAGGVSPQLAFLGWGVWSIGFGLVTLSLRRVVQGGKGTTHDGAWSFALPSLLLCACSTAAWISVSMAVAAMPTVGFAIGLLVAPPSPKRLPRIGWLLVMSSVATGLLLVRAIRTAA